MSDENQTSTIDAIIARIRASQAELEQEIARQSAAVRYRLEGRRVVFDAEMRRQHRALRVGLRDFLARTRPLEVLSAPFIYGLIVPLVLLDVSVALYQAVCFPVYGLPKVRRADHIRIDRHNLAYLNGLQKLNCMYCGYANGLISLVRQVAGRTEAYWCPIKHASAAKDPHPYYAGFVAFGDAEGYEAGLEQSRSAVSDEGEGR